MKKGGFHKKFYQYGLRLISISLFAALFFVTFVSCKKKQASQKNDCALSSDVLSVSEQGLIGLGRKPGLWFYDYSSQKSAPIPGTAQDGLNLSPLTAQSAMLYQGKIYYIDKSTAGELRFFTMNTHGAERRQLAVLSANKGEVWSVPSINLISHGQWQFTVLKDTLDPDPTKIQRRIDLYKLDLNSEKLECVHKTEAHNNPSLRLQCSDDTAVYYAVSEMATDRLSPEDYLRLAESDQRKTNFKDYTEYIQASSKLGIYRLPFGSAAAELVYEGKNIRLPLSTAYEKELYFCQDQMLKTLNLATQEIKDVTGMPDVYSLSFRVGQDLYYNEKSAYTSMVLHLDSLKSTALETDPQTKKPDFYPQYRVNDWLIGMSMKLGGISVITNKDYGKKDFTRMVAVDW